MAGPYSHAQLRVDHNGRNLRMTRITRSDWAPPTPHCPRPHGREKPPDLSARPWRSYVGAGASVSAVPDRQRARPLPPPANPCLADLSTTQRLERPAEMGDREAEYICIFFCGCPRTIETAKTHG